MQVAPDRISGQLARETAPVYLVAGDEPLQVLEAAQQIRDHARAAGISERLVFDAGQRGFDWSSLATDSANLSLFASRRLLDLRLPSGKPGRDGGKALREFVSNVSSDGDVLLITAGKIEKQSRSSAWFKAIDQAGVVVLCWPVRPNELPGWLHGRFASRGLSADAAACRALASRVEGNLLAAAQEVDKLALSHPAGEITAAQVEDAVSDNARFDVFKLSDAALLGELPRAVRVARGLRSEGAPLPVVAWALTRETRLLLTLRETLSAGGNVQAVYRANAVWDARKALLQRAMRRMDDQALTQALNLCAQLDRQVKGLAPGDPWLSVENVLSLLCQGRRVLTDVAGSG